MAASESSCHDLISGQHGKCTGMKGNLTKSLIAGLGLALDVHLLSDAVSCRKTGCCPKTVAAAAEIL
jgi:hypothetical protein